MNTKAGGVERWPQSFYGDGGNSGFDSQNPGWRFETMYGPQVSVNYEHGEPSKWLWVSDVLGTENQSFYVPVIGDPKVGGTIFVGQERVWRTTTFGGDRAFLERYCNHFTGDYANRPRPCGDWEPLGGSLLDGQGYGLDRTAGRGFDFVAAVERAPSDSQTLWAATSAGRVFVSQNANAKAAAGVKFARIDTLAAGDPQRFPSGIFVDPRNPLHAWISYSGYSANTPGAEGHVFSVTYDPRAGTASWTRIDGGTGGLPDLPVTDVVYDDLAGDLYASTDFGVLRLPSGSSTWVVAAEGLPSVSVAGLTIAAKDRKLYAATHGRGAWQVLLP